MAVALAFVALVVFLFRRRRATQVRRQFDHEELEMDQAGEDVIFERKQD